MPTIKTTTWLRTSHKCVSFTNKSLLSWLGVVYSQSIVWIYTTVAKQVSRVMASEEEPVEKWLSIFHQMLHSNCHDFAVYCEYSRSSKLTGCMFSYFLLISVSVTPFKDTFRLTMVGMKEPEAFWRVEDTAFCTAHGPVSISVGTAFR